MKQFAKVIHSNHSSINIGDIGEIKNTFQNGFEIEFEKKWEFPGLPKTPLEKRIIYLEKEQVEILNEIILFNMERDAALLSLDEHKIRAIVKKFNNKEMPANMEVFWGSVHKAITGALSLPKEFRQKSKDYLTKHNLKSFDDGDLT